MKAQYTNQYGERFTFDEEGKKRVKEFAKKVAVSTARLIANQRFESELQKRLDEFNRNQIAVSLAVALREQQKRKIHEELEKREELKKLQKHRDWQDSSIRAWRQVATTPNMEKHLYEVCDKYFEWMPQCSMEKAYESYKESKGEY